MKKVKILLVSHIYYTPSGPVYGPYNVIEDYLEQRDEKIATIEYNLDSKIPLSIKSILETINTLIKASFFRPKIFIGIDPLNAFAGILMKKMGLTKKTIFYCVDYTPTRFENKLLNSIYQSLDKFTARHSDEVWNVSQRIVEVRMTQGISSSNIKLVPNSPTFSDCPKTPAEKIDRNSIVMVAGLTHTPAMEMVLSAFKNVIKKYPKSKLSIIGTGPYQEKLKQKVKSMGIYKKVVFLGQLPNRELLNVVSRSAVSLAIYTFSKKFSWVYYGDSKKAREYLACGTPVIITDVLGTASDIKKYEAGIVIKPNENELELALIKIIKDDEFRLKCRKNALKLAKDFDINSILDSVLVF